MKNFEKFETEIMRIVREGHNIAIQNGFPVRCENIFCIKCDFNGIGGQCRDKRREWMESEYKEHPKLNKFEKALCESLQKGWFARDKADNFWYLYDHKPKKDKDVWRSIGKTITQQIRMVDASPKIKFDFIKWEDEEPWSVAELLKLEVEE
jgi:hypothetical protein